MLIGTVAAYDIPATLAVSILVAAATSSAGVGIFPLRTATKPLGKVYHPYVLVYKIPLLNIAVPGICYAGMWSYLMIVRTCTPGRL